MTRTIDAIYSGGVLKPVEPLEGLAENDRVTLTLAGPAASIPPHPLAGWAGGMGDADAAEMIRAIEEEFEKVDPNDWK